MPFPDDFAVGTELLHWYDTLRPRSRRGGATLGEGWLEAGDSRGRGSWKSQLLAAGVPLLFRRARVVGIFVVGAVAIGLVLLDHSHCSGDEEVEDPHAGHNH